VGNEYCDWYIEAAKVRLYSGTEAEAQQTRQVLAHVLEQSLRLLHPYMPYVTETIWQNFPQMGGTSRGLMVSRWPQNAGVADVESEEAFTQLQEMVRLIRNARSEYDVAASRRIAAQFSAGSQSGFIQENLALLVSLARLDEEQVVIEEELAAPAQAVTLAQGGVTIYLPLAGLVDLEAEKARIEKEMANIENQISRIQGKLSNAGFTDKAPAEVVERERSRLAEFQAKQTQMAERLADIA